MMVRQAATEAIVAGGMLALKMSDRAKCLMYSMTSTSPATNPPSDPKDFEKVHMTISARRPLP